MIKSLAFIYHIHHTSNSPRTPPSLIQALPQHCLSPSPHTFLQKKVSSLFGRGRQRGSGLTDKCRLDFGRPAGEARLWMTPLIISSGGLPGGGGGEGSDDRQDIYAKNGTCFIHIQGNTLN